MPDPSEPVLSREELESEVWRIFCELEVEFGTIDIYNFADELAKTEAMIRQRVEARERELVCEACGEVECEHGKKPHGWWCPICLQTLEWYEVTSGGTHDERSGGCSAEVQPYPSKCTRAEFERRQEEARER